LEESGIGLVRHCPVGTEEGAGKTAVRIADVLVEIRSKYLLIQVQTVTVMSVRSVNKSDIVSGVIINLNIAFVFSAHSSRN
jgi:hypothetical protein